MDVEKGTYVLATKWTDGDPGDAWAVGFYDGEIDGRHFVVDNDDKQIRITGYRRVGAVSKEVGHWLIAVAADVLEQSPPGSVNLWNMLNGEEEG